MSALDAFATAIETGDLKAVQLLIDCGLVDVNARLPRRLNPPALVHATFHRQKEMVDILLRSNACIDGTNVFGQTASHVAAEQNFADVLALLVARQPNLGLKDLVKQSPLESALLHGNNVVTVLLEAGAPLDGLSSRARCRLAATSTFAIQALIDRGVVIKELRTERNETPLHCAASGHCDRATFCMLVNVCGIDVEARDSEGWTCLHQAALCGRADVLRWLVEAGADVDNKNAGGSTALHFVRNCECTLVLLAARADVHARDMNGRTALHECVALSIAHVLLAGGSDLDAADSHGVTARQELARHGLPPVDTEHVAAARRSIAKSRLDFVRPRVLQVCIGLQALDLDALQICEILQYTCGALAPLISFHQWWQMATTVKRFSQQRLN